MTTNQSKNSTRRKNPILEHPIAFVLIALALVLIAIIIFRTIQDNQESASTTSEEQTSIPTATADSVNKTSTTDSVDDSAPDIIPEKTPAQYEGENANNSDSLTGAIITSAVEDDKLVIRVTIDQLLNSTGTCALTLTSASGRTLAYDANTIDNPSSASCEGFDIPLSDLTVGDWDLKINISAGDRTGVLEGKVTI